MNIFGNCVGRHAPSYHTLDHQLAFSSHEVSRSSMCLFRSSTIFLFAALKDWREVEKKCTLSMCPQGHLIPFFKLRADYLLGEETIQLHI